MNTEVIVTCAITGAGDTVGKHPAIPVTPKQIRVGGNVQSAKLVRQPKPVYPPLARQARIQGVVRFTAIIGKDGTIQNLQLMSGHPLLVQSAQDAVRHRAAQERAMQRVSDRQVVDEPPHAAQQRLVLQAQHAPAVQQ